MKEKKMANTTHYIEETDHEKKIFRASVEELKKLIIQEQERGLKFRSIPAQIILMPLRKVC